MVCLSNPLLGGSTMTVSAGINSFINLETSPQMNLAFVILFILAFSVALSIASATISMPKIFFTYLDTYKVMLPTPQYKSKIVDVMMPKLDGIATLRMMHDEDNTVTDDTPIIALTANAYTGARDEYRGHGFADYLSKPIEFRALENLIINYLPKDKLESIQE